MKKNKLNGTSATLYKKEQWCIYTKHYIVWFYIVLAAIQTALARDTHQPKSTRSIGAKIRKKQECRILKKNIYVPALE